MTHKIEYFDDLATSPALGLIAAFNHEMNVNGFDQGAGAGIINPNAWTVAAMDGDECIGFCAHVPFPEADCLWIQAAYVVPHRRGEGVHTDMFERVVYQAKLENVSSVQCGTHIKNSKARTAFEAQGRVPFGIMYRYDLKSAE